MEGLGHGLWRWLAGRRSVDADARHLRGLYGPDAEAWCVGALAALPPGDPRRKVVRRIARALHRIPARDVQPAPATQPAAFPDLMAHRRP